MPIVGPFEVTQPSHASGEVSAGCRKNRGLADLAAKLIAKAVPPGELSQPERRNETPALGQAQIEQIAVLMLDGLLGVVQAAQGFVEHDGRMDFLAYAGETDNVGVRHRLFHGSDVKRFQFTDSRGGLRYRPPFVGIDTQVHLATHAAANAAKSPYVI